MTPNSAVPRTYTFAELLRDLRTLATRVPSLWSIWIGGRLPRALREQVIVAVAQVNACRMCEHAHTRMALEAGVSDAELAALESMDEDAFDRRTWLAIAHARERTKAGFADVPAGQQQAALQEALGVQTMKDVEDVARVMTVANRVANTLNALPDRRRGEPIPGSRLADELIINFLFLPGAWLGTLVAAVRQRKSPFAVWRQARGWDGRGVSS
jgi:AhpD family alkylhydroperoxidase